MEEDMEAEVVPVLPRPASVYATGAPGTTSYTVASKFNVINVFFPAKFFLGKKRDFQGEGAMGGGYTPASKVVCIILYRCKFIKIGIAYMLISDGS
ncbi:hypothetical protein DICVIV_01742 [Dictyocaulus viviparus]|uniref:Uncharacterized protein n=1 Tax=Dictyocaulus viviparus TaxID=29172 RepID=A0A0D8YBU0_DICVI|nr:hypothetical protein DICVIV_01742 [Dictyocaulus viviparus]